MTFITGSWLPTNFLRLGGIDRLRVRVSSFIALNTGSVTAFARTPTDQIRADAERLSHIILEMQRCFLLHLSKELAPGNVSFPQFFLLAYLDRKEVLSMSEIAKKMGHTTAAASGLVARDGLHHAERLGSGPPNSRGNGWQHYENTEPPHTGRAKGVVPDLQQNLRLLSVEMILLWVAAVL